MTTDPDQYLADLDDDRTERCSWRRSEPAASTTVPAPQRPPRAMWRTAPTAPRLHALPDEKSMSPAAYFTGGADPIGEQRERCLAVIAQIREEMAQRRAEHADPVWRCVR